MLMNPPPSAFNTYKLAVTSHDQKLRPMLMGFYVQSTYGTDVYMMVFEGTTEPADGTEPLCASLFVQANAKNVSIEYPLGLRVNTPGLVIVASTTPYTLTKAAAATLSITADVERWEYPNMPSVNAGLLTAGDLTTNRTFLTVWNEASGVAAKKKLLKLEVIGSAAGDLYLVLFPDDSVLVASKIVWSVLVPTNARKVYSFGDGLSPFGFLNGSPKYACQLIVADSVGPVISASTMNIKAYYKLA